MTDRWGIDDHYVDALGAAKQVSARSVERLREIIGEPQDRQPTLVVRPGAPPARVGRGELHLEDGDVLAVPEVLPTDLPFGYHRFVDEAGQSQQIISSPGKCHLPSGWRAWGWAAQLYAARSSQSWGIGDLADLRRLGEWSRRLGAGFMLINPIGAVAPSGPSQPSPYFPTSRRFRNPLYLHVDEIPGAANLPEVAAAGRAGRRLNRERTINRDEVWRIKQATLETIWASDPPRKGFDQWLDEQPQSLAQFAQWSALVEKHGPSWTHWPSDCRDPGGRGVAAVPPERLRFHAWLQWLLAGQLDAASRDTAIIQDLPIGVDPHGFDAWTWQNVLALEASVGAPPDELARHGQDWGLPPFVPWRLAHEGYQPFIETVRASILTGGGLRIDHVMGLFRLWWIADGADAADGAYVRYPAKDLLAIVALESHRAGAVVVGEDLGTVEEEAQHALAEHNVLSYRLLWFEDDDPAKWPTKAMAAVTTHDLPTVAGLWDGSDLAAQQRLGLDPNEESTASMRSRLAEAARLPDGAGIAQAVEGAYQQLTRAPSVLLSATLDDALTVTERPNMPGADGKRPNWSLALPVGLEDLEVSPSAVAVAESLSHAVAVSTGTLRTGREGTNGGAHRE